MNSNKKLSEVLGKFGYDLDWSESQNNLVVGADNTGGAPSQVFFVDKLQQLDLKFANVYEPEEDCDDENEDQIELFINQLDDCIAICINDYY